jgi:hypothetical protein
VPDLAVAVFERRDQGAILAMGYGRNAPDRSIDGGTHGDAGARAMRMARPGVVRTRVEEAVDLVQKLRVAGLDGVIGDEVGGDRGLVHGVDRRHAADGVHPRAQPGKVGGDPVRWDPPIGIRRQQRAAPADQFGGCIHGEAPRCSGIGLGALQGSLDDVKLRPRARHRRARDIGRAIGRVIDQKDDMVGGFALPEERGETSPDVVLLIADRNGDGRRKSAKMGHGRSRK